MSTSPQRPGPSPDERQTSRARFRVTLVRVLSVQAVTLALLWLLQARYGL
jgi:hypothetical protein